MNTDTPLADDAADQPNAGLPRKFLRPFLLLALANDDTSHGYELCEAVRSRGLAVDLAGVYRALRTMEQHDLVTSSWEASDSGPDRRVYELTTKGHRAAFEASGELREIRDALSVALDSFRVGSKQTT